MEKKEINTTITEAGEQYKMNIRLSLTDKIDVYFMRPLEFTRGCIGNDYICVANAEQFRELSKALYKALVEGVKNSDSDNPDLRQLKKLFCERIIG